MPRGRLAELAVEEQVAGLGHAHIAADKVGIPLDQSFSVGKLGKGAVGCVSGFKAAGLDPEERGAQRSIGVAPGANLPRQRRNLDARGQEPGIVVALQRLAIGKAQQAGAIGDLRREFSFWSNGLVASDEREPLPEGSLIGRIGEAQEIRRAIAKAIGPGWRRAI